MTQPKSSLTLVLKILSLLSLLYAVYGLISFTITYVSLQFRMPAFIYVNGAEMLVSLAVSFILILIIFTNRDSSALFVPALILSIVPVFTLFAYIILSLNGQPISNILSIAFRSVIKAAVFLLIAIDARFGSKFALAEAITLAAFTVINTLANITRLALTMSHLANNSSKSAVFSAIITYILSLVFSSSAVIVLFLLRTHFQRKKEAPLC